MKIRKHSEVIRELLPMRGKTILDIGCGDGALTRLFAREGAQATGIDINETQLARARAAEPVPGATYEVGRGEALAVPDASVDAVVYMNSLHHVPQEKIAAALDEAARVLKPGGILLAIEPLPEGAHFEFGRPIHDETEVRGAAYAALKTAAESRFLWGHEEIYDAPVKYPDFAAYEARSRAVDPERASLFERHRVQLKEMFERLGRRDAEGVWFSQPTRANALTRA
jgi:ubiquinone/menaquinone biosynthesis C-methylase UbiE